MKKKLGVREFFRSLARLLSGQPNIPHSLKENQLLQIILNRRSVRSFTAAPIPEDAFQAILEAGRLAPSTVNLQTWAFAIFDDQSWREQFEGRPIPFKGQRAVIILADYHRVRQAIPEFPSSPLLKYSMAVMNASLAAMNMNIAAEALGISSVMLSETGRTGLLDIGYLQEKLSLPDHVVPIMTIVFGYPRNAYPPMPPKLPLQQICFTHTYTLPDSTILDDWLSQMMAGYKASHITSSFNTQLGIYRSKIDQAESDLQRIVSIPD